MSTTKPPTNGDHLRQCRHFIGQVAKPSEVAADFLIDIRCLRKGDPVWVKRTDRSWTYAVVKKRENGQNASVVVMVSSEGATKAFSIKRCPMFLRKVMDDDASENGVDGSMSDTISSSHSCSEISMDDSVRTFLDSVELFCSHNHHHDDIFNRSMQHHIESMHRLVDLSFAHHDQGGGNLETTRLPTFSCPTRTTSKNACPSLAPSSLPSSTPRHWFTRHTCQSTFHKTFKHHDHSPADQGTRIQPPPVARRPSWSMEIKKMSEGLRKIPKKRLDDLGLGDMLSRRHGNTEVLSFHHVPKASHGLFSEIPPLPFGKENIKEETIHLDEKLSIPRKKLHDLIIGEAVPPNHGNAGFESFQHALTSIHRRSSVFLPPVSGGGVTMH